MTVQELINYLETLPKNMKVFMEKNDKFELIPVSIENMYITNPISTEVLIFLNR